MKERGSHFKMGGVTNGILRPLDSVGRANNHFQVSCSSSFGVWLSNLKNDCSAAFRLSLSSHWNNVFGKDAIMM